VVGAHAGAEYDLGACSSRSPDIYSETFIYSETRTPPLCLFADL
jgi:hypothetical protein